MESKPSVSKKALAILGLMFVGSMAKKVDIVCDYKEVNCNVYDHSNGVCVKCSFRYWMTERHTCVQVDDQCKDWCPDNGDCTDCYQGWVLSKGKCVLPNQIGTGDICDSPIKKPKSHLRNVGQGPSCESENSCETESCQSVESCESVESCDAESCQSVQSCDSVESCEPESCESVESCQPESCESVESCQSVQSCELESCESASTESCQSGQTAPAKPGKPEKPGKPQTTKPGKGIGRVNNESKKDKSAKKQNPQGKPKGVKRGFTEKAPSSQTSGPKKQTPKHEAPYIKQKVPTAFDEGKKVPAKNKQQVKKVPVGIVPQGSKKSPKEGGVGMKHSTPQLKVDQKPKNQTIQKEIKNTGAKEGSFNTYIPKGDETRSKIQQGVKKQGTGGQNVIKQNKGPSKFDQKGTKKGDNLDGKDPSLFGTVKGGKDKKQLTGKTLFGSKQSAEIPQIIAQETKSVENKTQTGTIVKTTPVIQTITKTEPQKERVTEPITKTTAEISQKTIPQKGVKDTPKFEDPKANTSNVPTKQNITNGPKGTFGNKKP